MAAFNADEYLADQAVTLSGLSYSANGVRRLPIKDELAIALQQAVTAVYGPDYRVDVMSAAQPSGPKGTPGTTGTRRHGTGVAADVWVYDPNGRRLGGDELIPLSQHWLATDKGSVGFPANNKNSLHLDLIGGSGPGAVPLGKGEGRVWYYGSPSKSQRNALNDSLANGTTPSYAIAPSIVEKGLVPPAGIPGGAPTPATPSAGIAETRQGPQTAAQVLASIAGQQAQPSATPAAYTPAPQTFDPSIPRPAPVPSFRQPAAVPQPPLDVAEVYRGTPMQSAPASGPVPQQQQTPAQIYEGFPMRPDGQVAPAAAQPQTAPVAAPAPRMSPEEVAAIYAGTPMKPEGYTPPPTAETFAPNGKEALAIPLRTTGTAEAIPTSAYPTIQPTPTEGVTVAQDADVAPVPATPSAALTAARQRLAAERAKRAGQRIGEAAKEPETITGSGSNDSFGPKPKEIKIVDRRDEGVNVDKKPQNTVRPEGPPGSMPAAKKVPVPATQSAELRQRREGNVLVAPVPAVRSNVLTSSINVPSVLRPTITIYGGAPQPGNALVAVPASGNVLVPSRTRPLSDTTASLVSQYGSATGSPSWSIISGGAYANN